ncbi:hypothetical protein SGGMMB4_04262 [Sodalis glossinidius str. 'morsitans']|uniref:HTH araC/xylS-type domain-containing protein n=1 Tax=Sodalis glossinidius (strain morsitans) TaxID=343509 RepID=A0A193QM83_SODGM|nr:hypothetical protein SGGMMB4_04262 [Sodalis glossinidius str. 'morsitans']
MQVRAKLVARRENITTIALSVGYQSHTQFSREYSRLSAGRRQWTSPD